jgi:hypothetical protein
MPRATDVGVASSMEAFCSWGMRLSLGKRCELLVLWLLMVGWRDIYTGAPWGAEALAAAWAFSAGSFVAGFPGVE